MPSPSVVSQIRKLDLSLRQAACNDVLENHPVVLEGPLLPLENQDWFSNLMLDELRLKYDVSICRPSSHRLSTKAVCITFHSVIFNKKIYGHY
jgi:hypothetical protein